MLYILTLFESLLDRGVLAAERVRSRLEHRRHRRELSNTKAAIDALGISLAPVVRAQPMIDRRRVLSIPRHSSKRMH